MSTEALGTVKQVNAEVLETKQGVDGLKEQVEARSADVQRLDATIKGATAQVAALEGRVQAESTQVAQLQQRLKNAGTDKTAAALTNAMPGLFGRPEVMGAEGPINAESKLPGDLYVAYSLVANQKTRELLKASAAKVVENMQSLRDHGYKVFRGPVSMAESSGTSYSFFSVESGTHSLLGSESRPSPRRAPSCCDAGVIEAGRLPLRSPCATSVATPGGVSPYSTTGEILRVQQRTAIRRWRGFRATTALGICRRLAHIRENGVAVAHHKCWVD